MRRLLILAIFCVPVAVVASDNPRWNVGTHIPPRPDLDIRWEVSGKNFPAEVWIYKLLPNRFSAEAISSVESVCRFIRADVTKQDTNEIVFRDKQARRKLTISFAQSSILYDMPEKVFSPTNLAQNVPLLTHLPQLTKDLLKKIEIPAASVTGFISNEQFNCWEPTTVFYTGKTAVTNHAFRGVNFRRSVDGIPVLGGDGGRVYFGEDEQVTYLTVTWHNLERKSSHVTLPQEAIIGFLKQGKARQGLLPTGTPPLDWTAVKKLTVKKAEPYYYAGKSDRLYPFLVLLATADFANGNMELELETPIFDETAR